MVLQDSEANVSELLENLEEMFPRYLHIDMLNMNIPHHDVLPVANGLIMNKRRIMTTRR